MKNHFSNKATSIAELIFSITGPESATGFVARVWFKHSLVLLRKNTRVDSFLLYLKKNECLCLELSWKLKNLLKCQRSLLNKVLRVPRVPKYPRCRMSECPSSVRVPKCQSAQVPKCLDPVDSQRHFNVIIRRRWRCWHQTTSLTLKRRRVSTGECPSALRVPECLKCSSAQVSWEPECPRSALWLLLECPLSTLRALGHVEGTWRALRYSST